MSNLAVRDQDEPSLPDDGLPPQEIVIKDPTNPRSVYFLVPEPVQKAIDNVLEKYPHMFGLDEKQLIRNYHPSETMHIIRVAFWQEYFRVQDAGLPNMMISRIYAGLCHQSIFYKEILKKPGSVAFMLCPPKNFGMTMKAAMNRGLTNIMKIMDMKITDGKGNVDAKAAAVFLKAFDVVMNRVEGSIVQKSENKHAVITKNFNEDEAKMKLELEMLRKKYDVVEARPQSALDATGDIIVQIENREQE